MTPARLTFRSQEIDGALVDCPSDPPPWKGMPGANLGASARWRP